MRESISDAVRAVFSSRGYLPVETPLLESREVLERAGRIKGAPFQLIDNDDRLLMLRPDLTLPIARLVASRMGAADFPLRLRYQAPVVREQDSLKGVARQFTQLGVELVGGDDTAEAEVACLLGETLAALGVARWRIVCGSVRPLRALLAALSPSEAFSCRLMAFVHESDLVAADRLIESADLSPEAKGALKGVQRLHGGLEALDELDRLLSSVGVDLEEAGALELRSVAAAVEECLEAGRVAFDFSIISSFDYYTGLVFKAYAAGVPWSLASGGRYDAVLANLDVEAVAACGFALSLERLQEALEAVENPPRPLRVAVPKGSLMKPTVAMLERAGLPVDELRDPGRRLIIPAGEVEYVIVRATDAPAFVAFGGADCGFCGSDSLYEADQDLLVLQDLAYGACRFVVAEPASAAGRAEKNLARRGSLRVATKYPRITQAYYDRIGCAVDILALHGNIELGPIVGMADRIVDITATGTTLRENDLVVVDDDVMECSARFFASPAAYRTDARVRELADTFQNLMKEGDAA